MYEYGVTDVGLDPRARKSLVVLDIAVIEVEGLIAQPNFASILEEGNCSISPGRLQAWLVAVKVTVRGVTILLFEKAAAHVEQ